jgi:hypothetical protein
MRECARGAHDLIQSLGLGGCAAQIEQFEGEARFEQIANPSASRDR